MEFKDYLEFEEFTQVVKESVKARLDKEYEVRCNQVVKNNGVELVGLVIYKRGLCVAPNIYLDELYKRYMVSENLESIVDDIIKTYKKAIKSKFVATFDFDYDFENIKGNIYYRVVNYDKNKKLLETIPHKKFLDLAIIFYCLVNNTNDEVASIRITNEHLKMWEKNEKEILELASRNTPILFPGIIRSFRDVIKELIMKNSAVDVFGIEDELCRDSNAYYFTGKKLDEEVIDDMLKQITASKNCDMYVLSNVNSINGATAMLYNGLIEEFSNRIKSNLYILPSSIHEVILIPFNEDFSVEELKEMVKEINTTKVPDNEILSDSVYIYQRKESAIYM